MRQASYRVDWSLEDGRLELMDYGGNLNAAKAKARRLSLKDEILIAYVIETIDGSDTGQWVFSGGTTQGFET